MDETPAPHVTPAETADAAASTAAAALGLALTPEELERLTEVLDPAILALLALC